MCCCRHGKKFVPSFIPEKGQEETAELGIDKFEVAKEEGPNGGVDVKYGLNKREGSNVNGKPSTLTQAEKDALVLKEDLRSLPPESSLEEYEQMPVEAFGEALLRGMGWKEGRGIGRNAKGEVQAKELVRRPDRLGLGANPVPVATKEKKYIKPGEKRESENLVYVDENGSLKSSRPIDGKLQKLKSLGVVPGKQMYVESGRHSGFECQVISLQKNAEGAEQAVIRLLPSMETVVVKCKYLTEKKPPSHSEKGQKRSKSDAQASTKKQKVERPWLRANIRVKIIDKEAENGRLYLKKGTIVDVKSPTVCDVYVEDFQELFLVRSRLIYNRIPVPFLRCFSCFTGFITKTVRDMCAQKAGCNSDGSCWKIFRQSWPFASSVR